MPYFSVIIPSYNRKEKLKNAIESVLAQDEKDYELIIVDDGSIDGTSDLADKYKDTITYIFQKNSGVSAARNSGIAASHSPHITLLDSDDIWHKSKLIKHREYIERNPDIVIHQTEDIWIRNGVRINPGLKHLKPEGEIFIPSLELCLISPSSVCIHRSIFEEYGLFDEKLPACEDYDLWLRITPFEKIGLINEKLITRFAGHDDQLSSTYWGMDRFRLYSILKILHDIGDQIDSNYNYAAIDCASKKVKILLSGAKKRENANFTIILSEITNQLEAGFYKQIDYQSLLEI